MGVTTKLHQSWCRELMKSGQAAEMCRAKAQQVCDAANAQNHGTFSILQQTGEVSTRFLVVTRDKHAMNAQAKYGLLQKLL